MGEIAKLHWGIPPAKTASNRRKVRGKEGVIKRDVRRLKGTKVEKKKICVQRGGAQQPG